MDINSVVAAVTFPNLTQNKPALTALGKQLSPDDKANLGTITGISDFEHPEASLRYLPRMEELLAKNPNAVQNMANMPPQIRSAILANAAQKEKAAPGSGFADLEKIARGETPGQAPATPTSPQAAATDPAQTTAPTSATPGDASASTPPAGTPAAQGPDLMKTLMDSNPQMAGMFSRFTEVMQGLMGRLMTGLLGFIGKIFSGMDGSGGNIFAASNNPASNNLGNALAIGGADRHMPLSLQIGAESPRDTRVSDLQKPASAPPTLDGPTNRPDQNGPQFDPGTV